MAPSPSNNNDDFFYEIYLQHPSSLHKTIKEFRNYHQGIDNDVNQIIKQQSTQKINEAKEEARKQTLALIKQRQDQYAYSEQNIEYYCN